MYTVSVIIPTYNRIHVIGNAIKSALEQSFLPLEIILVDDGSVDQTVKFVKETFPSVTIIALEENQGASVARNEGIRIAKGDLIAFLDSDDIWNSRYLLSQVDYLNSYQNVGAVFSAHTKFYSNEKKMFLRLKWPIENLAFHIMLKDNCIHTMSLIVINKEVFHKVGLLREDLRICHDRDFYCRMLSHYKIGYNPENLVVKNYKNDQVTNDIRMWYKESSQLLQEFLSNAANAEAIENPSVYRYKLHKMFYPKIERSAFPFSKFKCYINCLWYRIFISNSDAASIASYIKE